MKITERHNAQVGFSLRRGWGAVVAGFLLALFILAAPGARAQDLGTQNLETLNFLARLSGFNSADEAIGESGLFGVSRAALNSISAADFANNINNALATGQGNDVAGQFGIGGIFNGAHPMTVADAAAILDAFRGEGGNGSVAQLAASTYGAIGVDLAKFLGFLFTTASPSSAQILVMDNMLQNFVLNPALTEEQQAAKDARSQASKGGMMGLRPILGAAIFYDHTDFTGGGDRNIYGLNLNATFEGEKLQGLVNLPMHWNSTGNSDSFTIGVDAGLKYEVVKGFSVGAHASYLAYSGDNTFEDYNWAAGPFLSYTFKLNDTFSISAGALFDFISPEISDDTWVGAFAVNLGTKLSPHLVLNTRYAYWRDLEDRGSFVDPDWHDVGMDLTWTLGNSWNLVLGAKTSLGYEPYDANYRIHMGALWRF